MNYPSTVCTCLVKHSGNSCMYASTIKISARVKLMWQASKLSIFAWSSRGTAAHINARMSREIIRSQLWDKEGGPALSWNNMVLLCERHKLSTYRYVLWLSLFCFFLLLASSLLHVELGSVLVWLGFAGWYEPWTEMVLVLCSQRGIITYKLSANLLFVCMVCFWF